MGKTIKAITLGGTRERGMKRNREGEDLGSLKAGITGPKKKEVNETADVQ